MTRSIRGPRSLAQCATFCGWMGLSSHVRSARAVLRRFRFSSTTAVTRSCCLLEMREPLAAATRCTRRGLLTRRSPSSIASADLAGSRARAAESSRRSVGPRGTSRAAPPTASSARFRFSTSLRRSRRALPRTRSALRVLASARRNRTARSWRAAPRAQPCASASVAWSCAAVIVDEVLVSLGACAAGLSVGDGDGVRRRQARSVLGGAAASAPGAASRAPRSLDLPGQLPRA